jgi:Raf kinase inhibitor-like YbhB/YbcL family protein
MRGMKTILPACLAALLLACGSGNDAGPADSGSAHAGTIKLSSTSFRDGDPIPAAYTPDGEDRAPELHWEGVPAGAKSLALLCDDPDAPGGSFTHWIVVDMLPGTPMILEGAPKTRMLMNGGMHGVNSFGTIGWGGPCPPSGTHHYVFTLFALDYQPKFEKEPTREEFDAAVKDHVLATGKLTGLYSAK